MVSCSCMYVNVSGQSSDSKVRIFLMLTKIYQGHVWATMCRLQNGAHMSTGYHSRHLIRTEVFSQPRIHQRIIFTILKCSQVASVKAMPGDDTLMLIT